MKLVSYFLLGLLCSIALPTDSMGQKNDTVVVSAQVKMDSSDSKLHLEAWCQNNTFQSNEFHYKFEAIKLGKSGKSNSSQSGKFSLDTGQEKSLATVNLNIVPGDSVAAELSVYADSVRIAEDHIRFRKN